MRLLSPTCLNLSRNLLTLVVGTLMVLSACGKKNPSSSAASSPLTGHDIRVSPSPAAFANKFIFTAEGAEGAKLYYSLQPFENVEAAFAYEGEVVFLPPVTLYVRSFIDGKLGPQESFEYKSQKSSQDVTKASGSKLVQDGGSLKSFLSGSFSSFQPESEEPQTKIKTIKIDGSLSEWPQKSRLKVLDAKFDTPNALNATDIVSFSTYEDKDYYYFAIDLYAKPRTDKDYAYGFDIGPSNIDFESFGLGVDFLYRLEMRDSKITVFDRSLDEETPKKIEVAASYLLGAMGDDIEIRVKKEAFPKLKGVKNLAVQALAGALFNKRYIVDYSPTLYMRSDFHMSRAAFELASKRSTEVDFFTAADVLELPVVSTILNMSKTFLRDIESFTGVEFFEQGSIPLYFSESDENGFSGLNASDRGVLTTRVLSSHSIEQAHVLLHEYAHFQNAISSQIKDLWLREGYSDWVAEALLYEYFPAKAVYDYINTIRYENYFSYNQIRREEFALAEWDISSLNPGYEKSLMVMNILEREVGREPLKQALQAGLNFDLDSEKLQAFLEHQSKKDLKNIFEQWVTKKNNDQFPRDEFRDSDQDGLLDFDEKTLGLDTEHKDSDLDGYMDGEEVFRGRDPKLSQLPSTFFDGKNNIAKIPTASLSSLVRLVPKSKEDTIFYSLNLTSTTPEERYVTPFLMRAPYSIAVKSSQSDTVFNIDQPLHDAAGREVFIPTLASTTLPATTLAQTRFHSGLQSDYTQPIAQDFTGDIPSNFSAYDLIDVDLTHEKEDIRIDLYTLTKPDAHGVYGRYEVRLRSAVWQEGSILSNTNFLLQIKRGVLSVTAIEDGKTISVDYHPFQTKVDFLADRIEVRLKRSLLESWLDSGRELTMCARSLITLETSYSLEDEVDCMTIESPDFNATTTLIPGYQGIGEHVFELFTEASLSLEKQQYLAKLGATAIGKFAEHLGRPLLDQRIWRMHYVEGQNSVAEIFASKNLGSYLRVAQGMETSSRDLLFVQQIARLYVESIIYHSTSEKLWVKDFLANWLTLSALYSILPTSEANAVYHDWVQQYLRRYGATCSVFTSSAEPLDNLFSPHQVTSSLTGKMLSMAGYMDQVVGSDVMSKVFRNFANIIPTTAQLQDMFIHYAPAQKDAIESIWNEWVLGDLSCTTREKFALTTNQLMQYQEDALQQRSVNVRTYIKD